MNCSATSPPSQCPTEAVETSPQNIHPPQDNTIDVTPTKAIKDWTWSDILVSPEHTNPCVRKAKKKTVGATIHDRQFMDGIKLNSNLCVR